MTDPDTLSLHSARVALLLGVLGLAACGGEPAQVEPSRRLAGVERLRPVALADSRLELVGLAEQHVERLDRVRDSVAGRGRPAVLAEFDRLHAQLVRELTALRQAGDDDWRAHVGPLEASLNELESLARELAEADA